MKTTVLRAAIALIALLLGSAGVHAQLTVDTSQPAQQIIQNLVGNGVQITNVTVTAAPNSYGAYNATGTELGTNQGLLMTTGRAVNAIGPNNSSGLPQLSGPPSFNCLNCNLFNNNFPGDSLLSVATNRSTYDACRIEFDIIPQGDSLKFNYTFASEEYPEWVGSPFNDVFGFFISGPGIGTDVNIALIPNSSQPVAINTVNATTNNQYFYNNQVPPGQFIQYDGFTVNLKAVVGGLIPCQTYHLKLIIADGSDRLYDSGVFIEKIESNPVVVLTATSGGLTYMVEGCNDGTITFSRTEVTPNAQTVIYWVGGTATNGVDYTQIGNGIPGSLNSIVIPGNQSSVTLPISAFADNEVEGDEYLTIYLDNPLCSNVQVLDSVNFFIQDFVTVNVLPDSSGICNGNCVRLTADAQDTGVSSFNWLPVNGTVQTPDSASTDVCPTQTTTYTFIYRVAQCIATDSVVVSVSNLDISVTATDTRCAGTGTGSVTAVVQGAVEPLTYAWTGPSGFTSSLQSPQGLSAGQYCVTVTDANGCTIEGCATVQQSNILNLGLPTLSDFTCFPISCFGACDGSISANPNGGTPPYTYTWNNNATSQSISNLCAGTYELTVTDSAGCQVSNTYVLGEPAQLQVQLVGSIDVLCSGQSTGQISVDANGGCTPYSYTWSHDPNLTTPVANNLQSGNYTVDVTDVNGCASNGSLTITVNPPINPLTLSVDSISAYPGGFGVSCPDANDGFANVTAANGTTPYTFEWRLLTTGSIFSNTEDLANAPCGVYSFTVADSNGCQISQNVTLTCVPDLNFQVTTQPNPCGDPNAIAGILDITTATGGNGGPYTYATAGPGCAPCLGQNLTGLASGNYLVTVADGQGCISTQTANIGNNDAFSATGTVTDAICAGSPTGSVDLQVTPAGTYVFSWTDSNGQVISSNQNISNVAAGNYTVTITSDGQTSGNNVDFLVSPNTDITVAYNGTHNFVSDMEFHLVGPASCGSPDVVLAARRGGGNLNCNSGQDFNGLVFTTTSSVNFDVCSATTPLSGVYGTSGTTPTPINWDALNGCSVLSPGWSVQIWDCIGGNNGVLNGAAITFSGTDTNGAAQTITYSSLTGGTLQSAIDDNTCSTSTAAAYTVTQSQIPNLGNGGGGSGGTCTGTYTFTVGEPDPIVIVPVSLIEPVCFGQNNGSIDIDVVGGTGPYTYSWAPSGFFPGASTQDIANIFTGSYTVTVTDSNLCTISQTFNVDAPQLLDIFIEVTEFNGGFNVSCAGANDGAITVTVSGGTPDCNQFAPNCYLYDWSGSLVNVGNYGTPPNDPNSPSLTGLPGGSYIVNVTDANGCLATTTVDLAEPGPITSDSTVTNVSCFGATDGTITHNVAGGSGTFQTYNWNPSVAPNASDATELTGLAAGCYTLTVTDNNQCTEQFTYCISEPEQLQLQVTASTPDCNTNTGSVLTITTSGGTGNINIETTGPGGPYIGNVVGPLGGGSYTVTATDANACSATQTVSVVDLQPFQLAINPILVDTGQVYTIRCFGANDATLQAVVTGGSGNFTYEWTDQNGTVLANTPLLIGVGVGTFCVHVEDPSGCSQDACYQVTGPDAPLVVSSVLGEYVPGYNISCHGACDGNIDLSVTGGVPEYTYLWDSGSGGVLDPNQDQTNLCGGYIEVLVTDANGCDTLVSFNLIEPTPIVITPVISTFDGGYNISCSGVCDGSVNLLLNGSFAPYTVDWTTPSLPQGTSQSDLCAGAYTIQVTDSAGCTANATYNLLEPEVLTATATGQYVCLTFDYDMCVTATGGSTNYSYSWTPNNVTTSCQTVTSSGNYCVTVTDTNGCTDQACVDAVVWPAVQVSSVDTQTSCGRNNGAIDLTVNGGSGGFNYFWTGPGAIGNTQDQTALSGGTYDVVVTDDQSGCQFNYTTNIGSSPAVIITQDVTPINCFSASTGAITIGFVNNQGPVTFQWTGPNNQNLGSSLTLANLPTGLYVVNWNDNVCSGSDTIGVFQNGPILINGDVFVYDNGFNTSGFGVSDGQIITDVIGGSGGDYSYNWSQLNQTVEPSSVNNLAAGTYTLSVTDSLGCRVDTTFVLREPFDIHLPNGLTPNGDKFNDTYVILGLGDNSSGELKVYNRWGSLVYEKNNYQNQWAGTNTGGDPLSDGTYYVVFKLGNREFNTYVDLRR